MRGAQELGGLVTEEGHVGQEVPSGQLEIDGRSAGDGGSTGTRRLDDRPRVGCDVGRAAGVAPRSNGTQVPAVGRLDEPQVVEQPTEQRDAQSRDAALGVGSDRWSRPPRSR